MGEAKRRKKLEIEMGDNCTHCGKPFLHSAPTYVGLIDGALVNVSDCCSDKLGTVHATGNYFSRNPDVAAYDAPYKKHDREWFERNPMRSYHVRLAYDEEIPGRPREVNDFCVVHQYKPGYRIKFHFKTTSAHGITLFPEDNEQFAQEIFDSLTKDLEKQPAQEAPTNVVVRQDKPPLRRVVLDEPAPKLHKSQTRRKSRKFSLYLGKVANPTGMVVSIDHQRYKLVRADHNEGKRYLVWVTHCWECKVAFEVTSSMNVEYLTRRCLEHRSPGRIAGRADE